MYVAAEVQGEHVARTKKSSTEKRRKKQKRENYVMTAYRQIAREGSKGLKKYSERKLAEEIRDMIENDLNSSGICKAISGQTITKMLRARDRGKFPTYPWDDRGSS